MGQRLAVILGDPRKTTHLLKRVNLYKLTAIHSTYRLYRFAFKNAKQYH